MVNRLNDRERALEDFDDQVLRHVAERFVRILPKKILCEWLARFPRFELLAEEIKKTSTLLMQIARGQARATKGFVLLNAGKRDEKRNHNETRS